MAIGTLKIENYLPVVKLNKGLRTALPIRTASTLTVDSTSTFTGAATFTAAPVFTTAPSGPVTSSVLASSGNTTITAAMSGATMLFDSAGGITYTLPTPVVGLTYYFFRSVLQTSSAHVITAGSGKFLLGTLAMFSGEVVTPSSTLGPFMVAGNGTTHIQYTTNCTTTGGGAGSWSKFVAISTTVWAVTGVEKSPSGSLATPFST